VQFEKADPDLRFAASVAAFAMLLRGSEFVENTTLHDVRDWANATLDSGTPPERETFLRLVDRAIEIGE